MLLRYLLLAIAAVLIAAVSLILFKYKKLHRRKEAVMRREDVVGQLFLRKIKKMEEEDKKKEPGELSKKLNKIMRRFFSELFEIKFEYANIELNEELCKKGITEGTRKEIIDYNMDMSEAEYGKGYKISYEKFDNLLAKSLKIIQKLTGFQEGGDISRFKPKIVPDKEPEKKPSELKPVEKAEPKKPEEKEETAGKTVKKKPYEPEEKKEESEEKKEEPSEEKKEEPAEKKEEGKGIEKYAPKEEKMVTETDIRVPAEEEERLRKIRKLLLDAEENVKQKRYDEAMENYSEIRELFDALKPETKAKIKAESKRVIDVYNCLLKQYSNIMTGEDIKSDKTKKNE